MHGKSPRVGLLVDSRLITKRQWSGCCSAFKDSSDALMRAAQADPSDICLFSQTSPQLPAGGAQCAPLSLHHPSSTRSRGGSGTSEVQGGGGGKWRGEGGPSGGHQRMTLHKARSRSVGTGGQSPPTVMYVLCI
ncbi:uncharacterized protein Tco025E_05961, partial [Trypanosoma conorhini]